MYQYNCLFILWFYWLLNMSKHFSSKLTHNRVFLNNLLKGSTWFCEILPYVKINLKCNWINWGYVHYPLSQHCGRTGRALLDLLKFSQRVTISCPSFAHTRKFLLCLAEFLANEIFLHQSWKAILAQKNNFLSDNFLMKNDSEILMFLI